MGCDLNRKARPLKRAATEATTETAGQHSAKGELGAPAAGLIAEWGDRMSADALGLRRKSGVEPPQPRFAAITAQLTRCPLGVGGDFGGGLVDEVFQFLAGLEERNFLRGDFYFFAGFGITADAAAAVACAEAAKAADFDFVALLQGGDDAFEDGFDNGLGFFARKLGNAQNLFDQVGLG